MPNLSANIIHCRAPLWAAWSVPPGLREGVQTKALAKRMQFNQC
jgi:hypothetical protein